MTSPRCPVTQLSISRWTNEVHRGVDVDQDHRSPDRRTERSPAVSQEARGAGVVDDDRLIVAEQCEDSVPGGFVGSSPFRERDALPAVEAAFLVDLVQADDLTRKGIYASDAATVLLPEKDRPQRSTSRPVSASPSLIVRRHGDEPAGSHDRSPGRTQGPSTGETSRGVDLV